MKRSSRSLKRVLACLAVLILWLPGRLAAQDPVSVPDVQVAVPDVQRVGQGLDRHAQAILQQAVEAVEAVTSLTAKIRQRVSVEGESLVGSGAYQQATYGDDCLFRLDLTIALGDQFATLIQVGDGRFVWTYRVTPDPTQPVAGVETIDLPMRSEMTRVDLNEVRRQKGATEILAFGGLPHTLRQITRNYTMESATKTQLQGLPVWSLQGKRKPQPEDPEEELSSADKYPDRLPEWIVLLVGQDDLLPYRIEFRNRPPASGDVDEDEGAAEREFTVAMDFFEVQIGAKIDPRAFAFQPRDHRVEDTTGEFVEQSNPR
ncbi:MAG: hypothetical protein AAGF97_11760 [Planctomycetota bacterium]